MKRFITRHALMHLLMWGLAILAMGFLTMREAPAGRVLNDALVTHPFRHHIWQEVLNQNVTSDGSVDFAHLRAYPRRLNDYLGQLERSSPENDPKAFPTKPDQTAYWINAHNAIALRLIMNHFPATSTTDVPDLETSRHYLLGGKPYALPEIRQKALAYQPGMATLLTMTNYSASAPAISPQAYEGKSLKAMSRQAQAKALKSGDFIRFQRASGGCVTIQLSPFLKNFESSLFTPPPGQEEDRDTFSEEPPPVTEHPMSWHELVKPFAPPDLYASLSRPCSQNVEFLPGNPTLRGLQLLRR